MVASPAVAKAMAHLTSSRTTDQRRILLPYKLSVEQFGVHPTDDNGYVTAGSYASEVSEKVIASETKARPTPSNVYFLTRNAGLARGYGFMASMKIARQLCQRMDCPARESMFNIVLADRDCNQKPSRNFARFNSTKRRIISHHLRRQSAHRPQQKERTNHSL